MDGSSINQSSEKGEEAFRSDLIGVSVPETTSDGFYAGSSPSDTLGDEQGNRFMSDISASFPEGSRIQQAFVVGNKVISSASQYNPLKGVSSMGQLTEKLKKEAVGCMDPREYSKPATRDEAIARWRANLAYFRISYGVTCIFFLVYFLLTSPFLLFEIALVLGVWMYFFKLKANEPVEIGSYKLENREKLAVAVLLTLLVTLFGGLISYLIWVALVSGLVISLHAVFRNKIEGNPLDDLAEAQQQFV